MKRTGDIGLIKVVSEGAVASGVRRIEALAGDEARAYLEAQDERVKQVSDLLKASPQDIAERVKALLDDRKKLERELSDAKKKLAMGGGGSAAGSGEDIADVSGVKLMAKTLDGVNPKDLRGLADDGKRQLGSGIVVLVGVNDEGRAGIVVGVTEDLTSDYNAVDLVQIGAEALGGKGGGGRPDMAQAGGPDGAQAAAALEAVSARIGELAGAA